MTSLKAYLTNEDFDSSIIDKTKDFSHLHVHTKYSIKDGLCRPKDLCKRLKELGYDSFAVTEHGTTYSIVDFTETAKDYGLKYIPGCEIYETDNRTIHTRNDSGGNRIPVYHFLLLACNDDGFKDLVRIVSDAGTVGKFDDNERTDFDFIEENNLGKNLIATSACLGGRVAQYLMEGDYDKAKALVLRLKNMFYQFYLELQDNEILTQNVVNRQLIDLSIDTGVPLIVTSDIHYVYQEDGDYHDTLICIGFKSKKHDCTRYRYEGDYPYYVRSPEELYNWADKHSIPYQAIYNAKLVGDFCSAKVPLKLNLMPIYDCPSGYDDSSYLQYLSYESLENYLVKLSLRNEKADVNQYINRLKMELDVICSKGYASYFLVLWDFVTFLKDNNIFQGTGRGSAAGSLLAFLLDITKIDPIIYGLQFERFLNVQRESFPDIDLDVPDIKRGQCIEYIKNKYGQDNVAQIITLGEIGVKSGIRDIVRVYDIDPAVANEISELLPDKMPDQSDITLDILMKLADDTDFARKYGAREGNIVGIATRFKEYMLEFPDVYNNLSRIEGVIRSKGLHAGGVVICRDKISNYIPVEKGTSTAVLDVVTIDMDSCDKVGIVKYDLLGLRTLSVISMALDNIYKNEGKRINLYDVSLKDNLVYKTLSEGHTHAVFQLSGGPITKFTRQVKPRKFEDLIDILALFRPGPLDSEIEPGVTMADRYIMNGSIAPDVYMKDTHDLLKPILQRSRGVMIYQEQIMSIVQVIAGYTLGESDNLRRLIGKKKLADVVPARWQFLYGKDAYSKISEAIDNETNPKEKEFLKECALKISKSSVNAPGAIEMGHSLSFSNSLFDAMEKFAGYSFNASHSAAYAYLSFLTSWLKVYYPVEFLSAQLTSEADDQDKTIANLKEAKRLGIPILPPDINKSDLQYTIERIIESDDSGVEHSRLAIRIGLLSIKGVGPAVIEEIRLVRSKLPFTDFDDFIQRVNARVINKTSVEILILSGVFDSFEENRYRLLNHYFFTVRKGKLYQGTIEEYLEAKASKDKTKRPKAEEYPKYSAADYTDKIRFDCEKKYIGMFVSGHPLDGLPYRKWETVLAEEPVKIGGRVKSIKNITTKKGKPMAFLTLETSAEDINCTLFTDVYLEYHEHLFKNNVIIVKGRKDINNGKESLIVESIRAPKKKYTQHYSSDVDQSEMSAAQVKPEISEDIPTVSTTAKKKNPLAELYQ